MTLDEYDRRKRRRLCTRCGKAKRVRGMTRCQPCREAVNRISRESMRRKYARNIARYGRARGRA